MDKLKARIATLETEAVTLNDIIDNLTMLVHDLRNESQTELLRALRMVDVHKINELEKAVAMWKNRSDLNGNRLTDVTDALDASRKAYIDLIDRSKALVEALEECDRRYHEGAIVIHGIHMSALTDFRKGKIGKPE